MTDNPFSPGLPPNLIPNPPGEIPAAPGAGDAVKSLLPFLEPQDVDSIIDNLVLDRPLKLYIPQELKHPDYDYRVINSIPQEIADAHNKGWREVTAPEVTALFTDLIAGTSKDGKAFRPVLVARPKAVTKHVAKGHRQQLHSLYAGMDPANKEFAGKYTENVVGGRDGSKGSFTGAGFRIKVV